MLQNISPGVVEVTMKIIVQIRYSTGTVLISVISLHSKNTNIMTDSSVWKSLPYYINMLTFLDKAYV